MTRTATQDKLEENKHAASKNSLQARNPSLRKLGSTKNQQKGNTSSKSLHEKEAQPQPKKVVIDKNAKMDNDSDEGVRLPKNSADYPIKSRD